jgi:hypothetical protein
MLFEVENLIELYILAACEPSFTFRACLINREKKAATAHHGAAFVILCIGCKAQCMSCLVV